jgi:hypothetical protein
MAVIYAPQPTCERAYHRPSKREPRHSGGCLWMGGLTEGYGTSFRRILNLELTVPRPRHATAHLEYAAGTTSSTWVKAIRRCQSKLRLGDASSPQPALELTGSRVAYRDTEARLTSFGESVLDGKASFLQVNGIDDWVAGVHLQSTADRVWLHDRGELIRR